MATPLRDNPDLIFFTNIPTPYRNAFYEALARRVNLSVFYMRETEADRNWKVDRSALNYPFVIDEGFYRMVGRFHVHFNPRLILRTLKTRARDIVIGGSWNDVDVLLLVIAKRLRLLKSRIHFWSEANYLTIGARNDNGLKSVVRRFVLNSADGAQLRSGKMTELTLDKWRVKVNGFVDLPNTIEESAFRISPAEVAAREANELPVFLIAARLDEQIKGILNFFKALGQDNIRRGKFIVAGDGPDREKIQAFIAEHNLQQHIELAGFCDSERMVDLYKQANVFVLPSFSDPCPLTLVEALSMHLPLLVSNRCGNHFETVTEGRNGYVFDPSDPATIMAAYELLLSRRTEWSSFAAVSYRRFEECFTRQSVIENFLMQLSQFAANGARRSPVANVSAES